MFTAKYLSLHMCQLCSEKYFQDKIRTVSKYNYKLRLKIYGLEI